MRWYDKDGSVVAPMQFIPLLEKSRMIIPVGHWIIENAIMTAKRWHEFMPEFEISVNISLYQLEEHTFYDFVKDCIERHQIDPSRIVFELTESHNIYDWDFVNKQFQAFHELGIKISMDDFGMGYSNLGFLKNFRCNQIKIDRVFVEDILNSEYDRQLVKHVVTRWAWKSALKASRTKLLTFICAMFATRTLSKASTSVIPKRKMSSSSVSISRFLIDWSDSP